MSPSAAAGIDDPIRGQAEVALLQGVSGKGSVTDAGPGALIGEFALTGGHGEADYLIFVNGKPVGALEGKP